MAIPFSLRPGDKLTYFPFNAIIKRFHLKLLLKNETFSGKITLKQDIFSLISVNVVNENSSVWTLTNLPLFKTYEFRDGIYVRKGLDLMLETNIASDKYEDIVFELEVEETNANYFHNYFEVFVLGENWILGNEEKFIYIPSYTDKELRRIIAEGFINEIRIFTHAKHNALSISAFDNLEFETSHHQFWDYYPYATYDEIVLDVNEVNVEYMFRVYKRWTAELTIGVPEDPDFADGVLFTHPFSFIIGAEFYDKEIRV
jgi:hypothetical protein